MCDLATRRDQVQYKQLMVGSLRMLAILLLPLTVMTIVLAAPVMRLIFDTDGSWSPAKVEACGTALAILSTGLLFSAIENVLMQDFFSRQRTVLPTVLGIVFAVLPVAALYVLIQHMGMGGHAFVLVCLAYPTGRALKNLCLLYFVHRHQPLMTAREAMAFLTRLALLCVAAGGAAWGAYLLLARFLPIDRFLGKKWWLFKVGISLHVGLPTLAALVAFLILCLVFKLEELQLIVRWVREKGWKKRRPAANSDAGL